MAVVQRSELGFPNAGQGDKTYTESFHNTKERIRKLFDKGELSASSYDTAWVAMVPSPHYSQTPCFPGCLDWLLENQLHDGSWGRPHHNPLLLKDTLSSTLASILALKRWMVGEEQINKGVSLVLCSIDSVPLLPFYVFFTTEKYLLGAGLRFIELNFSSAADNSLRSPIGFDIIFPGMLEYAQDLDLKINVEPTAVNAMTDKRKLELIRCKERNPQERDPYLAYISEGIGKSQDWEMVMKYQRKNGSLFNSPSTTAATFSHLQNAGCLNYLRSVVQKFGTADPLTEITKQHCYLDSLHGDLNATSDVLELYKASQIIIYPDEFALEKLHSWSESFLKQKLGEYSILSNGLGRNTFQEVDDAFDFRFHASLERMANKRYIEHYDVDGSRFLKTSYCSSSLSNKNFLKLALEDFNMCQSIQQNEEAYFNWWILENKIDKLKFARKTGPYCYFSIAATLFAPELFDARMTWAKASMLITVVDDFFDDGGSMEELLNLIQLVERWDVNVETDCLSEEIRIIFLALRRFICDTEDRAFLWQARSVKSHWLNLMRSMLKEAEWAKAATVPTMEEYIANAYVSYALEPIVPPTLYFLGPKLSHDVVQSSELNTLFKLMSTYGRLLNDMVTFKRESGQGKLNYVLLHVIHSNGAISEEKAIKEISSVLDSHRRELLRLVLQEKRSAVPRVCKELFWMMKKVNHFTYNKEDKFTFYDTRKTVKEIIHVPISHKKFNSSS
ncbi:hypothetical protein RJ640_004072 [Escallonia rubra]|uniref:Terpene synthase metal-binding domain-containing protein n=1 Tax=Escallonia rubra TaxID=112253 RepID=A0AA88QUK9_9ASTE|nr:hypothetical protein RJ640_004072 [Escallonia rubra]